MDYGLFLSGGGQQFLPEKKRLRHASYKTFQRKPKSLLKSINRSILTDQSMLFVCRRTCPLAVTLPQRQIGRFSNHIGHSSTQDCHFWLKLFFFQITMSVLQIEIGALLEACCNFCSILIRLPKRRHPL